MSHAIEGLQPQALWKHFAAISAIPRSSKHEAAVVQYVIREATRLACQVSRDKFGNILIRKPATPGYESAPSVCLQGHLDMVCEKNAGTEHDFLKDPIHLLRDQSKLRARGTTLGADNGIGVAAILSALEDETLTHGPIEVLFTLEEEIGLTGAKHLEPGFVQSRFLLNLDSEEEGALYIGCSGGRDTVGTWKPLWEEIRSKEAHARLRVKGLKGGHSGLDIDKQRGNAIKILARLLLPLHDKGVRLASLEGGSKRNAIPREAEAVLVVPEKLKGPLEALVNELSETIRAELSVADPGLQIELEWSSPKKAKVLKRVQARRILSTIHTAPHGVQKMSHDLAGLVQTSSNVGVLQTHKKLITLGTSQRSAVASELQAMAEQMSCLLELGGADVDSSHGYPGWQPNVQSPLLGLSLQTFEQLYGQKPAIKAIHAGLECGLISQKFPDLDMISFGPTIEDAHSPDESVDIPSVERFYGYFQAMLKQLSQLH